MIEVRIRFTSEARATHLCEWDASNLDALIPAFERWGVETDRNIAGPTGTFVYRDGEAYFELTLDDEDLT